MVQPVAVAGEEVVLVTVAVVEAVTVGREVMAEPLDQEEEY